MCLFVIQPLEGFITVDTVDRGGSKFPDFVQLNHILLSTLSFGIYCQSIDLTRVIHGIKLIELN